MTAASADDFKGTERFHVERVLGEGGFGVVYEAHDTHTGSRVALKRLRRADAAGLYRFKQEFRALADVSHPNLVQLYELLSEGEHWFFTMELVHGQHFLDYVWAGRAHEEADTGSLTRTSPILEVTPALVEEAPTLVSEMPSAPSAAARPETTSAAVRLDVERLRSSLAQLAEGLFALHDAGKLHRDVKPSNVLVTPEGRVVLLDFGLVRELASAVQPHDRLVGTVAYMSPEQGAGQEITTASDWYSVGALLFEALTGRVPFRGRPTDVISARQKWEPPAPMELVPGLPQDLSDLCRALLRREPQERMAGAEVLRRLGVRSARSPRPPLAAGAAPFVGRARELGSLAEAFQVARRGRPTVVEVTGRSGMGKSALVRRFLEELRQAEPAAVVLEGRCYERESVPYKALDSLVDGLTQFLRGPVAAGAGELLPPDVLALARLFPVLSEVEAVARADRAVLEIPDSLELRRRAMAALRELLRRLTAGRPVVLFIDDLQWGDLDSAGLLAELPSPPDPPAVLLVGAYRSEEAETSPFLRAFGEARQKWGGTVDWREVRVEELPHLEVKALARELGAQAAPELERIAQESGGSPLFVSELVRYWVGQGTAGEPDRGSGTAEITLDQMIARRVARLAGPARQLLEVVAVAGQPVSPEVARRAAELPGDLEPALAPLRAGRLVRTRQAAESQLECYHDRIREIVVAGLPAERLRGHHLRLARVLEGWRRADIETLAVHFQAAGEPERAAEFARQAADQAREALAFDRAARLYRLALDLRPGSPERDRPLFVQLGDARANAGRGREAADAYLAAAEGAPRMERLELQRRAAEQLLRSGHLDRGMATVRVVLEALGLKLASTPRRALLSLLLRRLVLRLRGLGYRERPASALSPDEQMRIEACFTIAVGLSLADNIHAGDFTERHCLLALRAGEPYRVARAYALEAGQMAAGGTRTAARTARLCAAARALADRLQHPHLLALSALMEGVTSHLEGRWRDAWRTTERAERLLRERCTGVAWEVVTSQSYWCMALLFMGRLRELSLRLPELLEDARERGDLFAAIRLRTRVASSLHLAADDPERARREVAQAEAESSHQGFHIQHYHALWAEVSVLLYAGDALGAWQRLERAWPQLRRSVLSRIQYVRIEMGHLRARCALARAAAEAAGPARQEWSQRAAADARRLQREGAPWGRALAGLVQGAAAASAGRTEDALSRLEAAEADCTATDMLLFAAAARRQRGRLLGGPSGQALLAAADEWMAGQSIRNPERTAALLVPGA